MQTAHRNGRRTIHAGPLEVRPGQSLALAGGRVLALSVGEYAVLVALASRDGRIVTRHEQFTAVWGGTLRDGDRSVDEYVHKLRAKLEAALPERSFIHTHVGFGYRSCEPSHAFHIGATAR